MNYLIIKNQHSAKANFELNKNFKDEFLWAIFYRKYDYGTSAETDLINYLHSFFERRYGIKIDLFVYLGEADEEIEVRERTDLYKHAITQTALEFYGKMRKIINEGSI